MFFVGGNFNGDMVMFDFVCCGFCFGFVMFVYYDDDDCGDVFYDVGVEKVFFVVVDWGYMVVSVCEDWVMVFFGDGVGLV